MAMPVAAISRGSELGSYRVLRELGEGGMGVVYEAEHRLLGRRVAIKTLRPEVAGDAELWRRLLLEAKALSSLDHPSIVKIYDFVTQGSMAYLVMEFVEGQDLEEVLATAGRLPAARVAEVLRPVAAALDHGHARGIIHRDLKPSNILLARDGRVMVMDFGLARVAGESMATDPNWMLGTPAYIAPEQMVDELIDARTDVYALSSLIFEAVTGRPPFIGGTWIEVASRRLTEAAPRACDLVHDVSHAFSRCLEAGLSRDANRRQASAGRLLAELALAAPASLPMTEVPPSRSFTRPTVRLAVDSLRSLFGSLRP